MLSRLRNMFRVPDLRNKILFTILIIAVYRLGAHIPVPYVDFGAIKQLQDQSNNGGVVGFLDLFSGGAITNVAIFFLGIMPYITASIIMQLLGVVIPKLEQWQQRGPGRAEEDHAVDPLRHRRPRARAVDRVRVRAAPGQERPARLRRLPGPGPDPATSTPAGPRSIVLTWTAGTAMVMWLGRAHHPARHRQRHVDPDLRVGGVAPARAGLARSSAEGSKFQFFTIIAHRRRR